MANLENRVLVVAPLGADARNISDVLAGADINAVVCRELGSTIDALAEGCGAILLAEEAMDSVHHSRLSALLERQPPWSDVPIVLITMGGKSNVLSTRSVQLLGPQANLTLIERPLRTSTLVAAVKSALRARRRQYQTRDLLEDRERLLATLEERVEERTSRLQRLVEELEAFSYSVSHDLRAPLRVLDGYAQALVEDYGASLEPGAKDLLDRIGRAARRMDRLTQDVLAYTRVSRAEFTLEPIDLASLLRDVIDQYPSLSSSRDRIRLRYPLGLVVGHGPSLTQCFSNLLENALKFVLPGDVPRTQIYTEALGDRLRVYVQDHGVGISPAHQERIFRMFERGAAHNHLPGTGIGLAIVKKAAERMGGTVGVISEPDQGARFWLEFARADPELASAAA